MTLDDAKVLASLELSKKDNFISLESKLSEKIDKKEKDSLELNKHPIKNLLLFLSYLLSDKNDEYLVWIRKIDNNHKIFNTKIYYYSKSIFYSKLNSSSVTKGSFEIEKNFIQIKRTFKESEKKYQLRSTIFNSIDITDYSKIDVIKNYKWYSMNEAIYNKIINKIFESNFLNKSEVYTIFDSDNNVSIDNYEDYDFSLDKMIEDIDEIDIVDYNKFIKI